MPMSGLAGHNGCFKYTQIRYTPNNEASKAEQGLWGAGRVTEQAEVGKTAHDAHTHLKGLVKRRSVGQRCDL